MTYLTVILVVASMIAAIEVGHGQAQLRRAQVWGRNRRERARRRKHSLELRDDRRDELEIVLQIDVSKGKHLTKRQSELVASWRFWAHHARLEHR